MTEFLRNVGEFVLGLLQNQFVFSALLSLVVIGVIFAVVAYSTFFERKVSAVIQDRLGPNRVGFFGLFWNFRFWGFGQPAADGLKFFLKEDIIPDNADKPLFVAAPALSFAVAMIGFVVIPWGGQVDVGGVLMNVQVANPDIGLLYLLGVGSMGVYGIVLGGWASNNKYSLYGAVRATAQMVSYEIPMGIAILVVVLTCGHIRLEGIAASQMGAGVPWLVCYHPLAFVILLITAFAETNRTPFDLAEAEQELVGGFHTEYSSMKFAMFFMGEYAHILTGCAFISVLFLGGWDLLPFVSVPYFRPEDHGILAAVLKFGVLLAKIVLLIFVFMWVRWTLPRFRFDQLMRLAWKGLIPMSLGLLLVAIVGLHLGLHNKLWFTLGGNVVVLIVSLIGAAAARIRVTGRQTDLSQVSVTG